MLKKLTATLLLSAFVIQTFSAPFIRLDYFFNAADYARNCINKARPEMNCNGRCQVMKKILAAEKKEQKEQENKMNSKVELVSARSFYTGSIPTNYAETIPNHYFIRNEGKETAMPRSLFRPPAS